eukprot:gene16872-23144_t
MESFSGSPSWSDLPSAKVPGKVLAEFIWISGTGPSALKSKTIVLDRRPASIDEVPVIVVDISDDSEDGIGMESFLKPRKYFPDPLRGGDHLLVLCDTYQPSQVKSSDLLVPAELRPHPTNNRASCEMLMGQSGDCQALFAVNQEYTVILGKSTARSESTEEARGVWPHSHLPDPTKAFIAESYLGENIPKAADCPNLGIASAGRDLADDLITACLHAGLHVNEVSNGAHHTAWCYRLGPLGALDISDELWMSRFLALRISEKRGLRISFDPLAAAQGPGGGGVCSVEFSTKETRRAGSGLETIQLHLQQLEAAHLKHIMAYGIGCAYLPLSAAFSFSLGNRRGSICVPTTTLLNTCGSYIDQRPSSNMDPYLVTSLLVATTQGTPMRIISTFGNVPLGRSPVETYTLPDSLPSHSGPGYSLDSDDVASLCSEEVLIEELGRRDAHEGCFEFDDEMDLEEGYGESSSCTSPPTRCPEACNVLDKAFNVLQVQIQKLPLAIIPSTE